ncbi:MAG: tetratricopeptide repeat protein [Pseudomonadota bacterium]
MVTDKNQPHKSKITIICMVLLAMLSGFKLYKSIVKPNDAKDCLPCISYYESKEYEKAYRTCSELASKGNIYAKAMLASLYEDGLYVQQDFDLAEKLYTEAVNDQSNQTARSAGCFGLGGLYMRKDFPKHDLKVSANWYKLSADQGMKQSQLKYGTMLFLGYGTEKNTELAKAYLQKASKNGLKKEADTILSVINSPDAHAAREEILKLLDNRKK